MATYNNYRELVGKELKKDDTVYLKGYKHTVEDTYLLCYQHSNSKIFEFLAPTYNKRALAEESY